MKPLWVIFPFFPFRLFIYLFLSNKHKHNEMKCTPFSVYSLGGIT